MLYKVLVKPRDDQNDRIEQLEKTFIKKINHLETLIKKMTKLNKIKVEEA